MAAFERWARREAQQFIAMLQKMGRQGQQVIFSNNDKKMKKALEAYKTGDLSPEQARALTDSLENSFKMRPGSTQGPAFLDFSGKPTRP